MTVQKPEGRTCLAIILAAGEGTRMKSSKPKVLHHLAGRSMLGHVIETVSQAGADHMAVVVGPDREDVAREARAVHPEVEIFVQKERRGTAHAVLSAAPILRNGAKDVLVVFGDTPLITYKTLCRLREPLANGAHVAVLGFEAADSKGYGRLIVSDGQLLSIREEADASSQEREVTLCNAGVMALKGDTALGLLERIDDQNAKGEFYLTDIVEVAREQGFRAVTVEAPEDEVRGINDRNQLSIAETILQNRYRNKAMAAGVTLIAPETVFFSYDTVIGKDTIIEPNVIFGLGVKIEENVTLHAFSYLEQAHLAAGAVVGPFARLRPGSIVGPNAKVGNFVELKNAHLGPGAKINHLSYIGDAVVGAKANVGAGTITCNYDGFFKSKTIIGEGAFIGSNSSLVAPVTIGENAYVGSGSVITKDVPKDALALARGLQVSKEGWAKAFRERAIAVKNNK